MNLYGLSAVGRTNSTRNAGTSNAYFTAYTPGQGNRAMEGGRATSSGAPMYTLEQFRAGKAPYVTGAMAGRATGRRVYTRLPGIGTVPIGLTDTGGGLRPGQIDLASSNRSYATNFPYQGQHQIYGSNPMSRIPRSGDVFSDYGGGSDIAGEPQVITTQNIPPNENVSPGLTTTFYPNLTEFGGGPNAPTYGSAGMGGSAPLTPFDPMGYGANPPPNEDVSPDLVNTFYGSTAFNGPPIRRGTAVGGGYPNLSGLPPVAVSAPYGTPSNPYPIPGYGGLPSNYGGGQSWQSNAARGGGGAGFAGAAAANLGFSGGLASRGGGGWQSISELPSGLGSMSWQQAVGGGYQRQQL